MNLFKRPFIPNAFCVFFLSMLLFGCTARKPILIGFTASLTGKHSEMSINLRNGVRLAVEEINTAGGIDGRMIELLVEDDLGTPEGAQEAESRLIDSGVVAVIGHLTSNQTVAGLEVSQARGVLLFSATAATSDLSGKDDLFFRTVATTDAMGGAFGQYIYQGRELSSIAIIYDEDNDTYSVPMKDAFIESFASLGGQITAQVGFPGGEELDYAPFVDDLIVANPEGIFIIANPLDTALISQTVRINGYQMALFCTPWCQANTMFQNGGSAIEGVELIIANDANATSPALEAFKINYEERFALPPIFIAMQAYESMQILAQALEKTAGEADGLPQALIEIDGFQGLSGEIQFDAYGDALRSLVIQRVIDGQFVTVESLTLSE